MLLLWGSKPAFPTPVVSAGPTFTDDEDGTGSFALTTDIATYAGVDYGASSGAYTLSAFDYSGAGPALELGTSHTIPIPDALAGGTNFGSWFYRVWLGTPAGFSGYVGAESTFAIAPVLSSATDGTPTTDGATDATVDTNCPTGTLYYGFVTNGGSCTNAQLIAGTGGNLVAGTTGSQAVSGTGTQTFDITGAAASTTYQIKTLHVVQGAESVQGSVSITTASASGTVSVDQTWQLGAGFGTTSAACNPYTDPPANGAIAVVAAEVSGGSATLDLPTDNFGDSGGGSWTAFSTNPIRPAGLGDGLYGWWRQVGTGATGDTVTINAPSSSSFQAATGTYKTTSGTWSVDAIVSATGFGTPNPSPGALSTSVDSTAILGIIVHDGSARSAASGFTAEANIAVLNRLQVEDKIGTAAGSETASWTGTGDVVFGAIGIAFKAT